MKALASVKFSIALLLHFFTGYLCILTLTFSFRNAKSCFFYLFIYFIVKHQMYIVHWKYFNTLMIWILISTEHVLCVWVKQDNGETAVIWLGNTDWKANSSQAFLTMRSSLCGQSSKNCDNSNNCNLLTLMFLSPFWGDLILNTRRISLNEVVKNS